MIFLDINKIIKNFNKKKIFLFNGDNIFLINENKMLIKKIYIKNEFINIKINTYTIWENIFILCKKKKLIINKIIFFLEFENNFINNKIFNNIYKLFKFYNTNIIIVLIGLKLTSVLKRFLINNNIYNFIININCIKNNINNFINYIEFLLKKMKFNLNIKSNKLFLKYFEGNLLELYNFLEILLLIYPNGNIDFINIKKFIYNSTDFICKNLIENLIINNLNKSLYILKNIRQKNIHPILLIYILQKELINIIKIKFNLNSNNINYKNILYIKIINKLTYNDFNNIFLILIKSEKLIKTNNIKLFWNEIKNLFILLCK